MGEFGETENISDCQELAGGETAKGLPNGSGVSMRGDRYWELDSSDGCITRGMRFMSRNYTL